MTSFRFINICFKIPGTPEFGVGSFGVVTHNALLMAFPLKSILLILTYLSSDCFGFPFIWTIFPLHSTCSFVGEMYLLQEDYRCLAFKFIQSVSNLTVWSCYVQGNNS